MLGGVELAAGTLEAAAREEQRRRRRCLHRVRVPEHIARAGVEGRVAQPRREVGERQRGGEVRGVGAQGAALGVERPLERPDARSASERKRVVPLPLGAAGFREREEVPGIGPARPQPGEPAELAPRVARVGILRDGAAAARARRSQDGHGDAGQRQRGGGRRRSR